MPRKRLNCRGVSGEAQIILLSLSAAELAPLLQIGRSCLAPKGVGQLGLADVAPIGTVPRVQSLPRGRDLGLEIVCA